MKRLLVAALLVALGTTGSSAPGSRSIFVRQTVQTSAQEPSSQKPDPPKADQEKIDPRKIDPKKIKPEKTNPVKPDSPKVEPQKVEPQKVDPRKIDPLKAGPQPEPPTFEIDPNLKARMGLVPGIDGGPERPLASVTDAKGNQADFVLNELIVSTNDMAELESLVTRWRGSILHTINFDSIKLKRGALRGLPKLHLLKIDPTNADVTNVSKDLRTVDPNCRGKLRISSAAGLKLLAAAAREAADRKITVSLNWAMYDEGLADGSTAETPGGDAGYNPNAFRWPYMNRGSAQDIGVAAAWQALSGAGKLGNRVRIMVADGGFLINEDVPDWREHFGVGDWGTRSFIPCAVGAGSCRWHGTQVVGAAMARYDNRFGIAGPAGPVAELIAVGRASDFFEFFVGVFGNLAALADAPDIINISAGARIPAAAAIFADPILSAIYGALRAAGTLVFAAAGNEGQDVDAEDCFGVCWEEAAWLPCEAGSVICVGGMDWDSTSRHPSSNWGSKNESASVDIWGPYVIWGYNDPKLENYSAAKIFGTSFASPFVAGIAALIWSADRGLSPTQVWEIMRDTAHHGGVFPYAHPDLRVNAYAAVKRALGDGNLPPLIDVTLTGGSLPTANLNRGVNVHASTADAEDGTPCCTITWNFTPTMSTDSGRSATFVFNTTGEKRITATATDRNGAAQSASLSVNVVNRPPVVIIEQPGSGSGLYQGQSVRLVGSATDYNEGPGPGPGNIECHRFEWTSSNAADRIPASGCDVSMAFTTTGTRILTLTATDPQGGAGFALARVNVQPAPGNYPPNITVGSLPSFNYDTGYRWNLPLALEASGTDPEGNNPITYRWVATSYYPNSSRVFAAAVTIAGPSSSASLSWTPSRTPSLFMRDCTGTGSYSGQVVKLTLEAVDNLGNRSTQTLRDTRVYRCFLV